MSRTVLITGGGTGFGRATAARFAKEGNTVYITGRRAEVLEDTAKTLGGNVTAIPCDGTDPDAVQAVVSRLAQPVDVLVNNAGGNTDFALPAGEGLTGTARRWRANYDANVLTAVLMTEAVTDKLAAGGAVIHIGSIGAEQGGSYGAAKAALAAFSSGLANELGQRSITSNVVAPGYFPDTEFFGAGLPRDRHDTLIALTAVGRHGDIEEIADAVWFLASPAARFITGQVLHVNGGAHRIR